MSLTTIYHKNLPPRVLEDHEAEELVKTGQWFNHPNLNEVNQHEEKPKKYKKSGQKQEPSEVDVRIEQRLRESAPEA